MRQVLDQSRREFPDPRDQGLRPLPLNIDRPGGGASAGGRPPANSNAHVGPHSIQVAPDGTLWITLALGNQLAQFDPVTEQ